MSGYGIFPMSGEHLDALVQVDALCFPDPWTHDGLKAELSSDTACFAAAVKGGLAVGCAGMHCICGECYIDKVCVHPDCRRQGIAEALVQYLIDDALAHQAEFITLEVRTGNTPAIALYQKLGFKPVGTRPNFYSEPKEDALLMTRYFNNEQLGNDSLRQSEIDTSLGEGGGGVIAMNNECGKSEICECKTEKGWRTRRP